MKWIRYILLIFVTVCHKGYCQEIDPAPSYQTVLMSNPAMSGSAENGSIKLSYLNLYPGNGYNFHSLYLSYDSYFEKIHGGAAFYLAEDYLGRNVNNLRCGVSYSYFLQAGENLFINAGLTASVFHQGFNFANSVLPDQIDPIRGAVFPSSETLSSSGRTVFDIGTGFTFKSGKVSGGIAVLHLSEPDLSLGRAQEEIIKRKLYVHLCGDFHVGRKESFFLNPIIFSGSQNIFFIAGAGTSIGNENVAISIIAMDDNAGNLNLQSGFSFKAGFLRFNYSYRFNIISESMLMPLSLLHKAEISFNLNNFDKRKRRNTIKFPEL